MIFHVSHNMQNVAGFKYFKTCVDTDLSLTFQFQIVCVKCFSENKVNQSTKVILDHENHVKVGWHIPSWDIPSMIKYGEPMLYGKKETDQITKT
jgi:hypothetical protein